MSTKKIGKKLGDFKLFYEEIARIKQANNRLRRGRKLA